MIYSWKEFMAVSILHEVFTKTCREDVDLPHANRRNSSFYQGKDNNEVNQSINEVDHQKEFGCRVVNRTSLQVLCLRTPPHF